jgi:ABC-2 type transport system ATP-binding protein
MTAMVRKDPVPVHRPPADGGGGPVVRVRGVVQRFGKKVALDGVDLDVEPGTFHGLIGPNGAGKTTLLEIIQGLRRPTEGTVELLGRPPLPRDPELLARVGIQPQRSAFFLRATAREHLETVGDLYGASRSRVQELVDQMGLGPAADTRVDKLSGGERQKLAVASAVLHRPEVLFLDEPTAALDANARHDLLDLLETVKDSGTTTVYTTHYLEEAERLCDVVSIIDHGRVVRTATPPALIAEANLRSRILLPRAAHQVDVLPSLATVLGVDVVRDGVLVTVADVSDAFADLRLAGVDADGAQVRNGGLEDVFFHLTGSEIDS